MSVVRTLARLLAILNEAFHGFHQFLKVGAAKMDHGHSASLPIHDCLPTSVNAIWCMKLKQYLNRINQCFVTKLYPTCAYLLPELNVE
jgi:hypothetical protein